MERISSVNKVKRRMLKSRIELPAERWESAKKVPITSLLPGKQAAAPLVQE